MTRSTGESNDGSGEVERRLAAIKRIHAKRDEYLGKDRQADIASIALPDTDLSPGRYVVETAADERIPTQHHRMIFRPLANGEPIQGIGFVYFFITTPYYEREDTEPTEAVEISTHATPQWYDIFIELRDRDDRQLGKYLLNSDGLIPYDTVGTAGDLTADVVPNDEYELSGNRFIARPANGDATGVRPFDIDTLNEVLTHYIPGKQTNRP